METTRRAASFGSDFQVAHAPSHSRTERLDDDDESPSSAKDTRARNLGQVISFALSAGSQHFPIAYFGLLFATGPAFSM